MSTSETRQIAICNTPMEYPTSVVELHESNDIAGNPDALRERMAEDGYIMIRGFHDRDVVLQARERFLAELAERERNPEKKAGRHNADIAATPEMLALVESSRLFDFWAAYFGEPALTFKEKWIRATPPGASTGVHYDNVYMGRGSSRLHTTWTPIGDIPMELGTLAICVGSHLNGFQRLKDTYGQLDVDRTPVKDGGWYTRDPLEVNEKFGGQWASTDFRAGDAVFFPMFTLHASTRNDRQELRLSCDVRFQPASDPADERWYGTERTGHSGAPGADAPTMDDMKSTWGV